MNLSVEHILMFALVVCALYYLMGNCDCKEGYVDPKLEAHNKARNKCSHVVKSCICNNRGLEGGKEKCIDLYNQTIFPIDNQELTCGDLRFDTNADEEDCEMYDIVRSQCNHRVKECICSGQKENRWGPKECTDIIDDYDLTWNDQKFTDLTCTELGYDPNVNVKTDC